MLTSFRKCVVKKDHLLQKYLYLSHRPYSINLLSNSCHLITKQFNNPISPIRIKKKKNPRDEKRL